ncbi:hypothetical protein [Mariniflexile sp.]|uniref:hypothetical protein n=1 Tax=Mariniflexile sp. TaxID=1979402 RepID=UPI0035689EBF
MENTDNIATSFDKLYKKAKDFTETSAELVALKAVDKLADVLSTLTAIIFIAIVVAMFTLFVNIGLGLLIGKLLNAYYLGFFIVSAFYLVLALLLYTYRDQLVKSPVANLIIKKLLKSKHSDLNIFDKLKNKHHEAA